MDEVIFEQGFGLESVWGLGIAIYSLWAVEV